MQVCLSAPEKVWREDIDMKKMQELFVEFEFRTLAMKITEVLSLDLSEKVEILPHYESE